MGSFEQLEKQLSTLVERATVHLGPTQGADSAAVGAAQEDISKAEALVQQLDVEARKSDPVQQPQLMTRLREHKIKLSVLKRDFRRKTGVVPSGASISSAASSQGELPSVLDVGSDSASEAGHTVDQRDRLLVTNARLDATSERLGTTRQLALQAEHMGVTILKDLHDQRQSLLRSHDVVHDVDDQISRARHILRSMGAKMNKNKWTIGLIIFLLFAAISVVIFAKLRR